MDPNSGRLYSQDEMARLPESFRARLVKLEGRASDIERISGAVQGLNRAERRKANRTNKLRSNGGSK